jgi:SWI/SNF-related matrix-associated actin-dependent regulator 1 of chromatin subfamily A
MEINGIKLSLYEYQKVGVEFLLNSGGRALLADSPGVGKTAQALGYVTHSFHRRTLVICPASVKFSWENEVEKWTNLKSFVIEPNTIFEDIPTDTDIIIINYDVLKKHFGELMKIKWDCLIGDEVQMIKSSTAIRSKAFKAISKSIPNVIMLTGTPLLSRPIEMYNMLSIIDPKYWNSYYSFATKYCDGHQGYWGFEAKGATNLDELRTKIGKYFLRRTKEEVLTELPPKVFMNIPIDLRGEDKKQYNLVEENLIKYLRDHKKTDKEIAKSLAAEKLVKLNLLREVSSMAKIETAKELINNIIESGEKVLVFSSFNGPLLELYEEYGENSELLIGSTPVEDRGVIVKNFQTNPNIKVFLGGTLSAGTGITLTAASNIIVLDYPWRPGDMEQLQNRAHRPGASYECLNIYQIVARDTIDVFMKNLLDFKQKIIDQLMDGEVEEEETDLIDAYIKSLEAKYKK